MRNIWIENFKRLNKFLMPICFVGCTYSIKHRNSKVFTANTHPNLGNPISDDTQDLIVNSPL